MIGKKTGLAASAAAEESLALYRRVLRNLEVRITRSQNSYKYVNVRRLTNPIIHSAMIFGVVVMLGTHTFFIHNFPLTADVEEEGTIICKAVFDAENG